MLMHTSLYFMLDLRRSRARECLSPHMRMRTSPLHGWSDLYRCITSLNFRLRLHVSCYFWIRDFFFPDEASVHTYQLTGQTLPFGNENFTITQNYPARSVKSLIACMKEMVLQRKPLEKTDFIVKITGPVGQFWQMESARIRNFLNPLSKVEISE